MDYYNEKDAEEALNALNGKEIGGRALTVAWSKQSSKFDPDKNVRSSGAGRDEQRCYNCDEKGHIARECSKKDT